MLTISRSLGIELVTKGSIENSNVLKAEIRVNFMQRSFRNKIKIILKYRHSKFQVERAHV